MPFTWQCVIQYHNQCLSPGNVSYGTITSAFHLAMCHPVPQPVPFIWQCVIRYNNQCNTTMRHTVPRPVQHDNATYGNTTSVFHMAMWHTVPRPVSFTWQSGNVSYGTTTNAFHVAQRLKVRLQVLTRCTFSVTWESSVIFFGYSFWKTTLKFVFKWESNNCNLYKAREWYRC